MCVQPDEAMLLRLVDQRGSRGVQMTSCPIGGALAADGAA